MLVAIKELGDYVKKREKLNDLDIFVDKTKLDKNTKKVLCLLLQYEGKVSYKKVILEDYESTKVSLYLYRGGSPRGVDFLPSALVGKDLKTTFKNKILSWFKNRNEKMFKIIGKELENKSKIIEKELIKKYDEIPKKERRSVLITIKLEEGGNEKYLGEVDTFKAYLVQDMVKSYYFLKSIGESLGKGICYLCGGSGEVYGFVLPSLRSSGFGFSFATADKPGFSPNFVQKDQWKEIPICKNCAVSLEIGKRFLDENLSFPKKKPSFLGCEYYVIPKFVFGELFDEFYDLLDYYKNEDYVDGLLSEEDYLEEIVKAKEDVLRLIFLFYIKKGGGKYIDIVRYVEDVLPSWIRELYDYQKKVKKIKIFQEVNMKKIMGKNWVGDFVSGLIGREVGLGRNNWFVKFTRDFISSSKLFINVLTSILSKNQVDKDFIISIFVNEIRNAYKKRNNYRLKLLTLKAFMLFLFLREINLLSGERMQDEEIKKECEEGDLESRVERFFEEYGFDNPAKRAAFSVGMLVEYLLYVQRKERGAEFGREPFWSNLYGLILDEKKVKGLFPKVINKLRQYGRGYPLLEKVVGKQLAKAEHDWNISNDETSYYFALGLTLRKMFLEEKESGS